MFKKIGFFSALAGLMISSVQAAESYIGQFVYRYEGGVAYRVTTKDNIEMRWECIEGPDKGAKGVEKPQRFKVDNKIYFATWTEQTGIQVSQALDFKSMKVYATIIDGKERYVLEGRITREK